MSHKQSFLIGLASFLVTATAMLAEPWLASAALI